MRKSARATPFSLTALLAALGLLCASFVGFGRGTPQGVQCPTASVQLVRAAVRDCCDRIVGYEMRNPKPGERAFVQCRCAEKKGASHQATLSSRFDFFIAAREPDLLPSKPEAGFVGHPYAPMTGSGGFPPRVRPPAAA